MRRCMLIICGLAVWMALNSSALALEFTADQITKIDGKTHKDFIYYRY